MSEKKGCEKMSQKHQKSQARSISVNAIAEKPLLIWDYVAFAAIAVFCFLVNPTPPYSDSPRLHTKPASETLSDSNGRRDDSPSNFPPTNCTPVHLADPNSQSQRRLVIIDARTVPLSKLDDKAGQSAAFSKRLRTGPRRSRHNLRIVPK